MNNIKSAEECLYERWKQWMEMEFDKINLSDLTFEEFKNETSWMFFIPAFETYTSQFKTDKVEDWDDIKFEYTEYSQAQFDSGNDYLPLIEWLKQYYSLSKK